MALTKSEFLGAWGKAFQIFKAIVDAILASGGSDEDVARLESLAPQIAALAISARPPNPEAVKEVHPQPAVLSNPPVSEVLQLTFDGDAPSNQPLELVRQFGYNPKGWKHNGPRVWRKQTCRFKLVPVGYCQDLEEVKERLKAHGKNREGQWLKAFKDDYPQLAANGLIGIPDDSWEDPDGRACFPVLSTKGPSFSSADSVRTGGWLWLVEVE